MPQKGARNGLQETRNRREVRGQGNIRRRLPDAYGCSGQLQFCKHEVPLRRFEVTIKLSLRQKYWRRDYNNQTT